METDLTATRDAAETAPKRTQREHFAFNVDAPGMVKVTNESHENPAEHQYVVTLDDVTGDAMACTRLHHVHRTAFYNHMTAIGKATDDGTLDVFPLYNDEDDAKQRSATVTASVVSSAGRAYKQDK